MLVARMGLDFISTEYYLNQLYAKKKKPDFIKDIY